MPTLQYLPYSLELKVPFGTAHGTRTHTDGMLVALNRGGLTGYGEVFLPPYYDENQGSMAAFFDSIDCEKLLRATELEDAICNVERVGPGNAGAKTAIDIALHDLFGKEAGISVWNMYRDERKVQSEGRGHPEPRKSAVDTSFTIGIDTIEKMVAKAREATEFRTLKIKLNGKNDVAVIEAIRNITEQGLFVDANQGWGDLDKAIDTADRLVELGVGLIEQPFSTGQHEKAGALKDSCKVPIVADEDVKCLEDIDRLAKYYDGVNIKLMKAGGVYRANQMISAARDRGLKILLGCMTESSIGISAAAQIADRADWCDLDGNLLIKNDTCTGVITSKGELHLSDDPGIGIKDDSLLRKLFSQTP